MQGKEAFDPFSHAEEALELKTVLDVIAARCENEGARRLIHELHPRTDLDWIEKALREVEDMKIWLVQEGGFTIADAGCGEAIRSAARVGESMPAKTLLSVASMERSVLGLRRLFRGKGERYPHLSRIVSRLVPHEALIGEISSAIDEDGSIKDRASPELGKLRNEIRTSRDRLRRSVERLAGTWGRESYPTVLGGRYVLLLPAERCRKREGIVHSKSSSGSSVYFEPLGIVEGNNALESLLEDERAEQARILRNLTLLVVESSDELLGNAATIEVLDALRAKAVFAGKLDCIIPALSTSSSLRLSKARHPILELSLRGGQGGREVVPLDLELGRETSALVITGPNAGGKTVALKTVGLVVLMHQCGLQVPCALGTELPVFQKVFADIGDEQSIASSLSTFTSHLQHLDTMCRWAEEDTLCLIDEIGDGTDPDEGAALSIATLEKLLGRRSMVIVTTHSGKVKTFALKTAGVGNASMAFEEESQRPLYRMLQGIAGRSRGLETARRCGFDPEVIRRAEVIFGEEGFRLESLLSELESSQLAVEEEREELQRRLRKLKQIMKSYAEREAAVERSREEQNDRARKEAEEILLRARREIEQIVKGIRESGAQKEKIKEGQEKIRELLRDMRVEKKPRQGGEVAPGDRVSLGRSGVPSGTVREVKKGTATVEIEGKKIKIEVWKLFKLPYGAGDSPKRPAYGVSLEPLDSTSLDVRGRDRVEAIEAIDRFIDRAVLSGVHRVKIIHGVGEGVLIRVIHRYLKDDKRVKGYRQGTVGEGGGGVSFVDLA